MQKSARLRRRCFNTQPPEGGCAGAGVTGAGLGCFNTQPPEGGWSLSHSANVPRIVSTLSRPKAAVASRMKCIEGDSVSTLSRPKAAGNLHAYCPALG